MDTEGIPNEKSSIFRRKSKILPIPLLGSYKVEIKNADYTTVKDDFLTSVSNCLHADVSYFLCCTRKRDVCVTPSLIVFQRPAGRVFYFA